ncbi:MAG: hypothetical protein ACI9BD_001400 [Candidatus Marinamargulisbacteria bacterium]
MRDLIKRLVIRLKGISVSLNQDGFTTQDIAVGLTMAVLIATVAIISGTSVLLDTQEKIHVFNAQAMAEAVRQIVIDEGIGPDFGSAEVFTLQSLYNRDRVASVIDSSSDEENPYNPIETHVLVKNVSRADADSGEASQLLFYCKLSNLDKSYTYIDQTQNENQSPVDARDLSRDHVKIPKRSEYGQSLE